MYGVDSLKTTKYKLILRNKFMIYLLRWELVNLGFKVALIVGTTLTIVNHNGCCINQDFIIRHPFQVFLCYLTPFFVSIFVGATHNPDKDRSGGSNADS